MAGRPTTRSELPLPGSATQVYSSKASFNYGDVWDATVPASAVWTNTFRLNSLYDPDQTGVGGTPSGAAIYLGADKPFYRYRVDSVDVEMRVANTTAAQTLLVGFIVAGDSVAITSGTIAQQIMLEGRASAWDFINSTTGMEHDSTVLRKHIELKDVVGPNWRDRDNTAIYNANPGVNAYLLPMVCNADGATLSGTARIVFRVTYHCTLFERNNFIVD